MIFHLRFEGTRIRFETLKEMYKISVAFLTISIKERRNKKCKMNYSPARRTSLRRRARQRALRARGFHAPSSQQPHTPFASSDLCFASFSLHGQFDTAFATSAAFPAIGWFAIGKEQILIDSTGVGVAQLLIGDGEGRRVGSLKRAGYWAFSRKLRYASLSITAQL